MNYARTPEKLHPVPNQPRPSNPHRSVRVEDQDWHDADFVAKVMGTNRAQIINLFLRWYLRRPGVELPDQGQPEAIADAAEAWRRKQAAADRQAETPEERQSDE